MRKSIESVLIIMMGMIFLTSCGCKHEWMEANCSTPRTCSVCGKQEGEIGNHVWVEANCTVAKTCDLCKITEGEPIGHDWVEATCKTLKICSVCQITEGTYSDHTAQVGVCLVCGEKVNEKLVQQIRSYNDTAFSILESSANNLGKIRGSKADKVIYLASSIDDANENYKKVIELCGTYPELATLKTYAQNIIDATPQYITSKTDSAANNYMNEYGSYLYKPANMEIELMRVEELFK